MLGLWLFILAFFPVKPALSGISGPESFHSPACHKAEDWNESSLPPDNLKLLYQELSGIPPSFDRLVLMVIDGLPAEFLLGKDGRPPPKDLAEAMPYTQTLLANRTAIGYHAKAAPPTVTMPRLKAIVSGAIGGFLDVAFNFNTQAFLDDNLLGQFSRIGWKMVMLGDETWLKLFPGLFARHDGVSSFYVKDTVQVDQNVSRHLPYELSRNDWNLLILHYLGLDHVGHIGGRNSILMALKLKEMDEVIKMIHLHTILQGNGEGRTLLVVVSDHGMTENGNHGGSSFEETDSLVLFLELKSRILGSSITTHNTANQVDMAPTLALLFGVPIPKNNIGIAIPEILNFLSEEHYLRALELNSWQLLRLLQAHLPGLSGGRFPCEGSIDTQRSEISNCSGSVETMFHCLYLNAAALHNSWKSKNISRSLSKDDTNRAITAYYKFLTTATEWLSHKATARPIGLLAFGIGAMLLSCFMLLSLLFCFCKESYLIEKKTTFRWHVDEIFVLAAIGILLASIGSSSLVEEEQYIWHFVISTFYLILFRKKIQSLPASSTILNKEEKTDCHHQVFFAILLLISARFLRGWHQGGVNWTDFPDISKWLVQAGSNRIRPMQLCSWLVLTSLSFFVLSLRGKKTFVLTFGFLYFASGLLTLQHMMEYSGTLSVLNYGATLIVQSIYAIIGIFSIGSLVASPWLMSASFFKPCFNSKSFRAGSVSKIQPENLLLGCRDCLYFIGWVYLSCWGLLQLLLQHPVNSMSVSLLFVQIVVSIFSWSGGRPRHDQWVEVAALYYLGMAGHFGLGNTNTLATIYVAGAFSGLSGHSTFGSGVLMFIITFAAPMFALLSMVMYISIRDTSYYDIPENAGVGYLLKTMLGFPCLVPLSLNSVLLTAYTIVLLLMRNHLFVWSVFSPKFLYACATTVCVYVGVCIFAVTGAYTCSVFPWCGKMKSFVGNLESNDQGD